MVVGFCSFGGWCYSERWVWILRTLAQFQGIELFPGLFQDNLKALPIMGSQFSISVLLNLCSESVGAQNFEILAEDSNTGGPSSFTVLMEYLFPFQFWYCKLCVENRWGARGKGGAESIVLLIFVLWHCFNRRYMRGCGLEQKVLLFQLGFEPMQ